MFFNKVQSMKPKSLVLTQEVLKDREHIEATVEGLSIQVRELLLLKDRVDCRSSDTGVDVIKDFTFHLLF